MQIEQETSALIKVSKEMISALDKMEANKGLNKADTENVRRCKANLWLCLERIESKINFQQTDIFQ